jgi:hypothetical protein
MSDNDDEDYKDPEEYFIPVARKTEDVVSELLNDTTKELVWHPSRKESINEC